MAIALQAYGTDTFATGGRGAPNAFSPASDGQLWTQPVGTATQSIVTVSSLQRGKLTTVDTANNVLFLGTLQFNDVEVTARFSVSAGAMKVGLLGRATGSNNYYRCDYQSSTGVLTVGISTGANAFTSLGTFTLPVASQPAVGSFFWLHLRIQGFASLGSNPNNILANCWKDGATEPTAWQVTGASSAIFVQGNAGIFCKAGTTGQTCTVDSFTWTDSGPPVNAPAYNTTGNRPYGTTLYVPNNNTPPLYPQEVIDLVGPNSASSVGFSQGCWLRYQMRWKNMETFQVGGVSYYDWGILDDAVQKANFNGFNILWPVQAPPDWQLGRDALGSSMTLNGAPGTGGNYIAGTPYSSINITALPNGAYIPHKSKLAINWNNGTQENVYVWDTVPKVYQQGATSINISSSNTSFVAWTPVNTHLTGEAVWEATNNATGGPCWAKSSAYVTICTLAATRYNGLNGYGKLDMMQCENEDYDTSNRIGPQGPYGGGANSPTVWDGSSTWDNGGAILAPIYVNVRNAVRAVQGMGGLPIFPCSVRKTPNTGRQHVINWMTGFASKVLANGGTIDGVDFHYYRNGTLDWDGTLITDPGVSTWMDSGHVTMNAPAVDVEVADILAACAASGFTPMVMCGETGWSIYDDGNGPVAPLSAARTPGGAPGGGYTTLAVTVPWSSVTPNNTANILDGTAITIDYNNVGISEVVYAWGTAAKDTSPIQITTNPAGHSAAQAGWTPINSHAIGAVVYGSTTTNIIDPNTQSTYLQRMYNKMRNAGATYCFIYTMDSGINGTHLGFNPAWADRPDNIVATISGTYTYEPAYAMTAAQSIQFPTWGTTPPPPPPPPIPGSNGLVKIQVIKVYKPDGTTFIDVVRDAPLLSGFKEAVNSAISPLQVTLPRSFDNFDLLGTGGPGTIAQGNVWKYYLFGPGLPVEGLLRYQGVVDAFQPTIAETGEETVVVTLVPQSSALADHGIGGTQAFGSTDPVAIFNWWFNNVDPLTGKPYSYPLVLSSTNQTTSGVSVSYPFTNQNLASIFATTVQMLPVNWFFRCNPDLTTTLNITPTTAQHTFLLGHDCSMLQYKQDWLNLKNVIYATGGTPAGFGPETVTITHLAGGPPATVFDAAFTNAHTGTWQIALDPTHIVATYASGGIGTPGVVTVTPLSMTNIFPGSKLMINQDNPGSANGVSEVVTVTSTTNTTFTANFSSKHLSTWSISLDPAYKINTTSKTQVAPGRQNTITPASTAGMAIGTKLYVGGGTNQRPYVSIASDPASIAVFGERLLLVNDSRIADQHTLDVVAQGYLSLLNQVVIRTVVRVVDYRGDTQPGLGEDIETIKVGDSCQIVNPNFGVGTQPSSLWGSAVWDSSSWDFAPGTGFGQIAVITALTYGFDYVDVEVSTLQPNQDAVLMRLRNTLQDFTLVTQ